MPTHSIILAWEIPWTEEPGRLQSTGLQRVILEFYLFSAALAVHCYAQAFSSYSEQELLFTMVQGLLIAKASLVAEPGL